MPLIERKGRDVKFNIDANDVGGAGASWQLIGLQRDGTANRSATTADAKSKDTSGAPKAVITGYEWNFAISGALDPADTQFQKLRDAVKSQTKVWIQRDASAAGGIIEEGLCIVATLEEGAPDGDLLTYSCDLTGDGDIAVSP